MTGPEGCRLPLTARPASDVLCWRGGRAITVGRFLTEVAALAARLPDRPYAINLCTDRYRALLGFAAALSRGQVTLLCADRAPQRLRALAARFPHAHVVADGPVDTALPVLRPDSASPPAAEGETAPAPLIPAEQVAAIAFTSGSTGEPAAHAKPWGALVSGAEAAAERFALRALDGPPAAVVATVPPQHMYGFETTLMLPLHSAAAQVAGETFYPSDVAEALAAVPARRVLVTTPLQLRALLAAGTAPPPLAAIISATAPLSPALAEAVERAWDAPVLEIYGATEAGSMASRRTVDDPDWLPYRGVSLHPGGVTVAGLGPVPLADALEPTAAGRFRLLGRESDVVKLGGRRASLAELNRLLLAVDGVEDGVFLAPDDLESNPAARLSAFVVAPGRTAEDILSALRGRTEAIFLPRPVVLVPALPRDGLGKLPRRALLELRRSRPMTGASPAAAARTGRFAVPPDHPSLPGHFPGHPVVPGVVLLDAVFALAATSPAKLLRAKFAAPVGPGEEVEVAFEERAGNRLGFSCRCRGAVVLTGEFEAQESGA